MCYKVYCSMIQRSRRGGTTRAPSLYSFPVVVFCWKEAADDVAASVIHRGANGTRQCF